MIPVVAGLVVRDGKYLICQADKPAYGGLMWEFPGGKLEAGESPEAALERELKEELGIETRAGRVYDVARHVYADTGRDVLVMFYSAEILSGEPRALDGQRIAWASPDQLSGYAFAPADASVVRRLAREKLTVERLY